MIWKKHTVVLYLISLFHLLKIYHTEYSQSVPSFFDPPAENVPQGILSFCSICWKSTTRNTLILIASFLVPPFENVAQGLHSFYIFFFFPPVENVPHGILFIPYLRSVLYPLKMYHREYSHSTRSFFVPPFENVPHGILSFYTFFPCSISWKLTTRNTLIFHLLSLFYPLKKYHTDYSHSKFSFFVPPVENVPHRIRSLYIFHFCSTCWKCTTRNTLHSSPSFYVSHVENVAHGIL